MNGRPLVAHFRFYNICDQSYSLLTNPLRVFSVASKTPFFPNLLNFLFIYNVTCGSSDVVL